MSQSRLNQPSTSNPARWQTASATAMPMSQSAIFSSRLWRERSWNGVTVLTVWWNALTERG